jgi:hypothetical protein
VALQQLMVQWLIMLLQWLTSNVRRVLQEQLDHMLISGLLVAAWLTGSLHVPLQLEAEHTAECRCCILEDH